MFTTYPLPAEVQMFSAMMCPQPTRVALERANVWHVFVQLRGRSLRTVALAAERCSSSMVTNHFWRPAIVDLSQFLMQASSSHGDVCSCTDATEKGFAFAVREG